MIPYIEEAKNLIEANGKEFYLRNFVIRKSNCLNFKTVYKILCTKIVYPVKSNNSGKVCPHCPMEVIFPNFHWKKGELLLLLRSLLTF